MDTKQEEPKIEDKKKEGKKNKEKKDKKKGEKDGPKGDQKAKVKVVKGARDFLPFQMAIRNKAFKIITDVLKNMVQ